MKETKPEILQKYDLVSVPFDGVGIIREYNDKLWGSSYTVEIIKTQSPMYEVGQLEEIFVDKVNKIEL